MANKNLGVGIQLDRQKIEGELKELKEMIQKATEGMSDGIALTKQQLAQEKLRIQELKITTKERIAQIKKESEQLKLAAKATDRFASSQKKMNATAQDGYKAILNLHGGIKGYIADIQNMINVQMRWYGAKTALFYLAEVPVQAIRSGIEYAKLIDEWNAKLLRWGATGSEVTATVREGVKSLIMEMRKTTLEVPIEFDTLGQALEAFVGAGVDVSTVQNMTKEIAVMASSFPEINMEKFGVAITGLFNAFKGADIGGAVTDAERFKVIFRELLSAQAVGVIKPENFTKIAQYMGEMGRIAGLSIEQILALNVAITNTGVTSNSSARLLASFITRLSEVRPQKALEQLGISVDATKDFASQMETILGGLKKALTAGGSSNMGAIGFVNQIAGKEATKVLLPLLQQLEDIPALVKRIQSSTDTWEQQNKIKAQSIKGQWTLITSTMNELLLATGPSANGISAVTTGLLEMARAALYAFEPSFATKENIDSLGGAGQTTYGIMKSLATILQDVTKGLLPLATGLANVADQLLRIKDLAGVLISFTVGAKVGKIGGAWGSLIGGTAASMAYIYSQSNNSQSSGLSDVTLGGRTNLDEYKYRNLLAGVQGVEATTDSAKKRLELLKELANVESQISSYKGKSLDENSTSALTSLQNKIHTMESWFNASEGAGTVGGPNKFPSTDKTGNDKTGKSYANKEFKAAKELAKAKLEIAKSNYDLQYAELTNFYKLGGLTTEEYYIKEQDNAAENLKYKLQALENEKTAIIDTYRTNIAEAGNDAGKRKVIEDQYAASMTKVEADTIKTKNDYYKELSDLATNYYQKLKDQAMKAVEHEVAIAKQGEEAKLSQSKWATEERTKQNEWLYSNGRMGATEYYAEEERAIKENLEYSLESLRVQYEEFKATQTQKKNMAVGNLEELTELYREDEKRFNQYENDKAEAVRSATSSMREKYRKFADDVKAQFGQGGANGVVNVIKLAVQKIQADYLNMGQAIYNITNDTTSAMKSGFDDFLDYESDNFLDFKELVTSVLHDIYTSMIENLITKPASAGLTSGLQSIVNSLLGTGSTPGLSYSATGSYGFLNGSAKGNVFSTPGLAPYMNTVVDKPTLFAFAQGGVFAEKGSEAVMPLTRTSGGDLGVKAVSGTSEVKVSLVVNNNTGQQVSARQETSQINAQEIVVTLWLDALNRNAYGLRTALGQ